VFANVDNSDTIAREEIFGPVLSITPARDEEQATAIANDTNYGPNAGIFTNDPETVYAIGGRIRSGMVGITDSSPTSPPPSAASGSRASAAKVSSRVSMPNLESKTMTFEVMPAGQKR